MTVPTVPLTAFWWLEWWALEQTKRVYVHEREREGERSHHPSWWEVWDELRRPVRYRRIFLACPPLSLSLSLPPSRSLPLSVSLFPPFLSATSLPEGKCTKPIRKSGVPAGPCVRYAAVKGPLFAVFTGDVEKNRGAALPHGPRRVCFCSAQPAASLSGLWSTQDVDQNAIAHSERAWHRERKCSCPETPERYRAWGRSGNDPGMWLFCALAGAG